MGNNFDIWIILQLIVPYEPRDQIRFCRGSVIPDVAKERGGDIEKGLAMTHDCTYLPHKRGAWYEGGAGKDVQIH
jgi:hypothetical protein